MSLSGPAGIAALGGRSAIVTALVFLGATLLGAIAGPSLGLSRASSSSPVAAPIDTPIDTAPGDRLVRRRLTVFDSDRPAVARLDPALLGALRHAAAAAARDGVEISITSGWRSPEYQKRLLRQAISTYGSPGNAARWVATPDTSAHVSGRAVDIGPSRATAWLSRHGAAYRLCQVYRNEPWHYELRPRAADDGCPPMYADPRHDPRMQP